MQTFLPFKNYSLSAGILDYRRLGKQSVESHQIAGILLGELGVDSMGGYKNHPCNNMWRGYVPALLYYTQIMITEWLQRGYKAPMRIETQKRQLDAARALNLTARMPHFTPEMHLSHIANLVHKDANFYIPAFNDYGVRFPPLQWEDWTFDKPDYIWETPTDWISDTDLENWFLLY